MLGLAKHGLTPDGDGCQTIPQRRPTVSTPQHIPTSPPRPPARWDRAQATAFLADFEHADSQGTSQRQFAQQQQLPRSTLRYWQQRKAQLTLDPVVAAFLETPQGLTWLQRLLLALHLVFTQQGPAGIRLVCDFLRLSQLDRVLAASYGAQQQFAAQLEQALVCYGDQERQRLAATMPPKSISVCEDETFHPEICLVAIEPVSNFLLLETYAAQRDAATWNQHLTQALDGLPVHVVQAVSDEAKGLRAHAAHGLGVPHGPDVFHVQHEVLKGTAPALAAQTRQAERHCTQATEQLHQVQAQQQQAVAAEPPLSSPPRDEAPRLATVQEQAARLVTAQEQAAAAAAVLAQQQERQQRLTAAVRALGTAYHPFDLTSGAPRNATQVEEQLTAAFTELETLATAAALPERCHARIAKGRRVLPQLVASVAFFWGRVQAALAPWPPAVAQVLVGTLLAGHYLLQAAAKASCAETRAALRQRGEQCLAEASWPEGLSAAAVSQLEVLARESATWFVRSSACVEGRNGQLALRHHSLHRLGTRKLRALTVIHNYWLQRPGGATAAERFFGAKPQPLFEWLLERLPLPARPAKRRVKAA
jgi:Family of unknown function (DUF6399)